MRPYLPSDYPELRSWYQAWGLSPPAEHQLPSTGLIIPGVCAGFIYKTDSSIALLEGLISSKDVETLSRSASLNQVIQALFGVAKDLGFRQIYGFTQISSVESKAEELGAVRLPGEYKLLVKEV